MVVIYSLKHPAIDASLDSFAWLLINEWSCITIISSGSEAKVHWQFYCELSKDLGIIIIGW